VITDSLTDAIAELRASSLFRKWKRRVIERSNLTKDGAPALMAEKHYSPSELSEIWNVSVQTIRAVFENEEGVLKIGRDGTRTRRRYKTLRIPESVAARVHTRLSA
jgi:hypothetical protein